VEDLLRFLFNEYRLEDLKGTMAVSRSPSLRFVIERSSEWNVRFVGMVKILDLASVLRKFAPQIGRRCRGLGLAGHLTLEMTGNGQVATLSLGKGIRTGGRRWGRILRLSDTAMVRLLFGVIPPSHALDLPDSFDYLDALFPLDFYVGRLDYV
jgi:hypothetical protein